jgi:hypothetical protein
VRNSDTLYETTHSWNSELQNVEGRIIRIYFELVFLYPVHPVDPVRKWTVYAVNFFIRLNWPLWQLAGTANRRISNIEPQNVEGLNRFALSFLK